VQREPPALPAPGRLLVYLFDPARQQQPVRSPPAQPQVLLCVSILSLCPPPARNSVPSFNRLNELRFMNPALDRAEVIADEGSVIHPSVQRLTDAPISRLTKASMAGELKSGKPSGSICFRRLAGALSIRLSDRNPPASQALSAPFSWPPGFRCRSCRPLRQLPHSRVW